MSRDRWAGLLAGQPLLAGLAREGATRRHARERSEDEDEFEAEEESARGEDETLRLAAADGERVYRDAVYAVAVTAGQVTQTAGPAGLTLVVGVTRIALVPGTAAALPPGWTGEELSGIDRRGRRLRLVP